MEESNSSFEEYMRRWEEREKHIRQMQEEIQRMQKETSERLARLIARSEKNERRFCRAVKAFLQAWDMEGGEGAKS